MCRLLWFALCLQGSYACPLSVIVTCQFPEETTCELTGVSLNDCVGSIIVNGDLALSGDVNAAQVSNIVIGSTGRLVSGSFAISSSVAFPNLDTLTVDGSLSIRGSIAATQVSNIVIGSTGSLVISGSVAFPNLDTLTVDGYLSVQGSIGATQVSNIVIGSTGGLTISSSVAFPNLATLAVDGSLYIYGDANAPILATLTVDRRMYIYGDATFSELDALTVDGELSISGDANVPNLATLTVDGELSIYGDATFSELETLTLDGKLSFGGDATFSNLYSLTLDRHVSFAGNVQLSVLDTLTIEEGGMLECTTALCKLDVLAWSITIAGTLRGGDVRISSRTDLSVPASGLVTTSGLGDEVRRRRAPAAYWDGTCAQQAVGSLSHPQAFGQGAIASARGGGRLLVEACGIFRLDGNLSSSGAPAQRRRSPYNVYESMRRRYQWTSGWHTYYYHQLYATGGSVLILTTTIEGGGSISARAGTDEPETSYCHDSCPVGKGGPIAIHAQVFSGFTGAFDSAGACCCDSGDFHYGVSPMGLQELLYPRPGDDANSTRASCTRTNTRSTTTSTGSTGPSTSASSTGHSITTTLSTSTTTTSSPSTVTMSTPSSTTATLQPEHATASVDTTTTTASESGDLTLAVEDSAETTTTTTTASESGDLTLAVEDSAETTTTTTTASESGDLTLAVEDSAETSDATNMTLFVAIAASICGCACVCVCVAMVMCIVKSRPKTYKIAREHRLPVEAWKEVPAGEPASGVPLLQGVVDEGTRSALARMLHVPDPFELGVGHDAHHYEREYNHLEFYAAWKVEHPAFRKMYEAGRDAIAGKMAQFSKQGCKREDAVPILSGAHAMPGVCDHSVNEVWLLQGTKPESVYPIISQGLKVNVSRLDGLLGAGIYFAEEATKMDQYTTPDSRYEQEGLEDLHARLFRAGKGVKHPNDDLFYCLVVRVVLGWSVQTLDAKTHAETGEFVFRDDEKRELASVPGSNPPLPYDSVVLGTGKRVKRFREFVIYTNTQCYIEYLMAYKRVLQ